MRETPGNLGLLVREGIIQHPHSRGVALAQIESFDRIEVSRLRVLQLVEVFMHGGEQPGRTSLALGAGRSADHDYRRRSERRECCLQVRRKLARTGVPATSDLLHLCWWRRMMRKKFCVGRDQHQRGGDFAPAGPNTVLNVRPDSIELDNAGRVVLWNL